MRQKRVLTSLVLVIAFLFTALALPIVSSSPTKKELSEFAIKPTSDQSGGNVQFPLAEKENKEEENGNKKEQHLGADLINPGIDFPVLLSYRQNFTHQFTAKVFQRPIPLYLSKRHLLI